MDLKQRIVVICCAAAGISGTISIQALIVPLDDSFQAVGVSLYVNILFYALALTFHKLPQNQAETDWVIYRTAIILGLTHFVTGVVALFFAQPWANTVSIVGAFTVIAFMVIIRHDQRIQRAAQATA